MKISLNNTVFKTCTSIPSKSLSSSSGVNFCGIEDVEEKENFYKSQARKIFGDKKEFLASDYDALTKNQKVILNECAKKCGVTHDYRLLMFSYKQLKKGIEKEFPNGFTLVSVGRSPARYARMFEIEGYDVKYCPSVSLKPGYSYIKKNKGYLDGYEKYLRSIGLEKNSVRTAKKPFVCVDYTQSGQSLDTFKTILLNFQIGGKKLFYRSINDDFWGFGRESTKFFEHIKKELMSDIYHGGFFTDMKDYSPVPHLPFDADWRKQNVAKFISSFKEPVESKLMSFVMLDRKYGKTFLKRLLGMR